MSYINWLKNPFVQFFGAIAAVAGILSALGAPINVFNDLRNIWSVGWIVSAGFLVLWINAATRRSTRDSEDCLDEHVYVVRREERLRQELFGNGPSVIGGAREFIYVTGSRSRMAPYLKEIENQMKNNGALKYVRVLFGPPQNQQLVDHLREVMKIAEARTDPIGSHHIEIAYHELGAIRPERNMVCSERKAFIALPSFHTIDGLDTALVIDEDKVARDLGGLIKDLAITATVRCRTVEELEDFLREHSNDAVEG